MDKLKHFTSIKNPFYDCLYQITHFLDTKNAKNKIEAYSSSLQEEGFSLKEVKKAVSKIIKTFDHFPSYPALKKIVSEFRTPETIRANNKEEVFRNEKGAAKFTFCQECMAYLALDCNAVWEYLDKNKIEIPENYTQLVKATSRHEMFELILGDAVKTIKKIKGFGLFGSLKKGEHKNTELLEGDS